MTTQVAGQRYTRPMAGFLRGALLAVAGLQVASALATPQLDVSALFASHVRPGRTYDKRASTPELLVGRLKRLGVIEPTTRDRVDFADYFMAAEGTTFLGAKVILIRHEQRRDGDVGCCENPAIGFVLQATGRQTSALARVAKRNACRLESPYPLKRELSFMPAVTRLPNVRYANLDCSVSSLHAAGGE